MKIIYTLIILLAANTGFSNTKFVDFYKTRKVTSNIIRIPMAFDSDSLLRKIPVSRIGKVYQIDYVATGKVGGVGPRQKGLDKDRWQKLISLLGLEKDDVYKTDTYYQTRYKDEEQASTLFHGFVVYYNLPESIMHATAQNNLDLKIETIFGEDLTESPAKTKVIDSVHVGDIDKARKDRITKVLETKYQLVEWHYDSVGVDKRFYNSRYVLLKVAAGIYTAYKGLKSTRLFEQLNRNRITSNTLIVTDMTGSMYPYYEQLLIWHALKLNGKERIPFIFFNDGDAKSTESKRIGETGGIYSVLSNKSTQVYKTMKECMKKGGGGDLPENNLEAVISGLKKYKSIDKVILICDNWAYPRDANLSSLIGVPVEFVMCGADFGLSTQYLNLVSKMNGASINTMEKSIAEMDTLSPGDSFVIGEERFTRQKDNGFVSEKMIPVLRR